MEGIIYPGATVAVNGTASLSVLLPCPGSFIETQIAKFDRVLTMADLLPVPGPILTRYMEPFISLAVVVPGSPDIDGGQFDSSYQNTLDGGQFGENYNDAVDGGSF
jgi:hypothetical protein